MTSIANVSVPTATIPPGSVLADTNARVDFVRHVPVSGDARHYLRVVGCDDLDALERAVRADPRVAELQAIDRASSRPLYRIEWAAPPPCSALYRSDLLVERMSASPAGWSFRVRAGDPDALRELQRNCRDAGVHLEVEQLDHSPDDTRSDPYGLTPKQRTILAVATEAGYFSVPRETTLAELGERFGISDQAVSECLRRGQRNLVRSTVLAESTSTPVPL